MREAKLIAMLALALTVYAAAGVGTASGALAPWAVQVWNCDPHAATPVGRGGIVREPDLAETHADLPASAKGKAGQKVYGDRARVLPRRFRRIDRESHGRADR